MIQTSEMTAHLEGIFQARLDIAQRRAWADPSIQNQVRLEEATKTHETIFGILYQFEESNSQGD